MDLAMPGTLYPNDYAAPPFLIPRVEPDSDVIDQSAARCIHRDRRQLRRWDPRASFA